MNNSFICNHQSTFGTWGAGASSNVLLEDPCYCFFLTGDLQMIAIKINLNAGLLIYYNVFC